jgi:NADH-quinone oxidoreductase subunit J
MTTYDLIFYFFALTTVGSAAVVVFSRNIVHAAFSLLFTFFGVAGMYVLLSADFIAVSQLLIYVGGIMVLVLFGVMLTNNVLSVDIKTGVMQTFPASILTAALAGVLCGIYTITDWQIIPPAAEEISTIKAIGEMFMTTYVLPFEIASVALLVALIGAALVARRERIR